MFYTYVLKSLKDGEWYLDAFTRERFLKSGPGKQYLKNRLRRPLDSTGFTLIEVSVVIALFVVLASLSLYLSFDVYRGYALRTERALVVSVLQRARGQAVANMCLGTGCSDGQSHGVRVLADRYVIFQGLSYATRQASLDETYDASSVVGHGGLSEVVFSQLSGEAATTGGNTLNLTQAGQSIDITVNYEGGISW